VNLKFFLCLLVELNKSDILSNEVTTLRQKLFLLIKFIFLLKIEMKKKSTKASAFKHI
jgi:hypothetical protein